MDDTINTGALKQPNTFMDIIAPRSAGLAVPRSAPKKSATLMRSAVKKPSPKVATSEPSYGQSPLAASADLAQAASLTDQSPLISRFSVNNSFNPEIATPPITENEAPETFNFPSMDQASSTPETEYNYSAANESAEAAEAAAVALNPPALNIFEQGLNNIEDKLPLSKNKRRSWKRLSGWTILGVVAIGVIGGSIFVNQNFSKLQLYLASSKAGFSATLPSIKPSGYDLSSISTASGAIAASYKSNSDSRNYSINEEKSAMSSSQLLNNYVQNEANFNYQVVKTDGHTIYIYNGHDAAWVSRGIWYIIEDNNSLSDHQIINIANSM